jgi:hypothetical protein
MKDRKEGRRSGMRGWTNKRDRKGIWKEGRKQRGRRMEEQGEGTLLT